MRILHTSDLHLDAPMGARLSAEKIRQRRAELLSSFASMIEEAQLLGVRLFIISGDLLDSDRVTRRTCERILNLMERAETIDFLYLPGNHEKQALLNSGVPVPRNLRIFGEGWTYFNYDFLTVAGRSESSIAMFSDLSLDPSRLNIAVLHGAVADRSGEGGIIGLADAMDKSIDYMALGHYHSYSVRKLDDRGIAVYSGTPEGRGFDEVGTKGFVIIDTDGRRLTHRFTPFARRTLHINEVDVSDCTRRLDIEERVASSVSGVRSEDLVRVVLTGSRPPELYADLEAIKLRFGGSFYHFEIEDSSRARIDPEDYRYDKSLKGEFIRLVMSKPDLDESDKELIIRCGLAALMGETTDI